MLLFSTASITVDGVTVFPDHADKNQFWYLPAPVNLATLPDSEEPQFLLIEYTPDLAASGVQGVGFLNVTLCLKLADDTRNALMGQIRSVFPDADNPHLAPVPFDEGSVQIVALDLQGGGGTSNTARDGTFEAVEHILGAVSPELFGDNNALFALTLTEAGASILKAAFEDGMAPVGGIYNLKFTGVRPALDVKITADLKRVYDSFSVGLTAKAYWVSAGIDATFEKLRQDGAIKIEVVNLAGDQASADKEQQALALFKDQILTTWFTPSLTPATAAAADAGVPALPAQKDPAPAKSGAAGADAAGGKAGGAGHPPAGGIAAGMGPAKKVEAPAAGHQAGGAAGGMAPAHPGGAGTPPAAGSPGAAKAGEGGGAGGAADGAGGAAGGAAAGAGAGATGAGAAGTGAGAATGGAAAGADAGAGAGKAGAAGAGTDAGGAAGGAAAAADAGKAGAAGKGADGAAKPTAAGQAAGLVNAVSGAANAAAGAASPFGVALKLKFVSQDEQKTVTYEYNRMDAVQRTYAPQGYFGLLLSKIDKSKHFLQVDGTDPFFTRFSVAITPPHDFTSIGLQTAHVALDYGDASGDNPKHGEFNFDATHTAPTSWDVFEGQVRATGFTYTADYAFDAESGWVGAQDSYQLPPVTTENRQLTLDPFSILGFLAVTLTPGRIDPNVVDRVEVALQYGVPGGWQTTGSFIVRAGAAAQTWKVRLADKTQRTYSYTTSCVLKDGTVFASAPFTSTASAVVVNDAFNGAIDVEVQPALDATKTKVALIELDYQDDAAGYRYRNTLSLPPGNMQPTLMHIPVLDRTKLGFSYRIITIGTDGQQHKGELVTTQDPVVLVGDTP